MKRQKLEIGHPLAISVTWYDHVPEPPKDVIYDGEVIGWRDSQLIVRAKEYAVVRFWKDTGLEVRSDVRAIGMLLERTAAFGDVQGH